MSVLFTNYAKYKKKMVKKKYENMVHNIRAHRTMCLTGLQWHFNNNFNVKQLFI